MLAHDRERAQLQPELQPPPSASTLPAGYRTLRERRWVGQHPDLQSDGPAMDGRSARRGWQGSNVHSQALTTASRRDRSYLPSVQPQGMSTPTRSSTSQRRARSRMWSLGHL